MGQSVGNNRLNRLHVAGAPVSRFSLLLFSSILVSGCVSSSDSLNYSSVNQAPVSGNVALLQNDTTSGGNKTNNELANTANTQQGQLKVPVRAPRTSTVVQNTNASNNNPASAPLAIADTGQVAKQQVAQTNIINKTVDTSQQPIKLAALNQDTGAQQSIQQTTNQPATVASAPQKTTTVAAKPQKTSFRRGRDDTQTQVRSENTGRSFFSLFSRNTKKPRPPKTVAKARNTTGTRSALPGVKSNAELFGIKENKTAQTSQATQVAALGGLGRLSPNGLRVQHSKVQVACLKPGVLRILKIVERRYKSKPIITSGYRSPRGNRRAGGARNSQHIFCKAVDIQVEGITKWQLAKFLRTIPGRGGVGTYCRTKSVHFDIGSKRDWHHKCRRSSVKKRKKT